MLSSPVGAFSLNFLIGYSTSLSVFGSNLPMNISPKSVYQTLPSLSTSTSCGSLVGRTTSYWVTIARVSRPLGRGCVFSSYGHWSTAQVDGREIVGQLAILLGR